MLEDVLTAFNWIPGFYCWVFQNIASEAPQFFVSLTNKHEAFKVSIRYQKAFIVKTILIKKSSSLAIH